MLKFIVPMEQEVKFGKMCLDCTLEISLWIEFEDALGTVHFIFWGGGPGIYVWAGKFFSDNIGVRLFFSPALRAGLFLS